MFAVRYKELFTLYNVMSIGYAELRKNSISIVLAVIRSRTTCVAPIQPTLRGARLTECRQI